MHWLIAIAEEALDNRMVRDIWNWLPGCARWKEPATTHTNYSSNNLPSVLTFLSRAVLEAEPRWKWIIWKIYKYLMHLNPTDSLRTVVSGERLSKSPSHPMTSCQWARAAGAVESQFCTHSQPGEKYCHLRASWIAEAAGKQSSPWHMVE